MTEVEKRSAIKRLNERLTDMARTFGPRSPLFKEYLNKIKTVVGPDNMHTPPKQEPRPGKKATAGELGIPLITRSKDTYATLDEDSIEALLSHHTAGRIKKEIREEAKRTSRETGETVTPQDVLDAWEEVYDVINEHYSTFYDAVKMYWDVAGKGNPRPSYMTLDDIIDAQAEAKHAENESEEQEILSSIKRQISDQVSGAVQRIFS